MKKASIILAILLSISISVMPCLAHFGMVIPSDSMVMPEDNRTISIAISFSHPFEGIGMKLSRPGRFMVMVNGKTQELITGLRQSKVMGEQAWQLDYKINRPGVYTFFMEPEPYWEPAEDCYIIHYTKTAVGAFGSEEGWDDPLGIKTEIVPLTRPFGLYTGNLFQGVVMLNGGPVPYAEVEVEYYNKDGKAEAPTDYMITQVLKSDSNGVFSYTVPKAGWWGFAALNMSDEKIKHKGENKDVELGAVIWVEFHEWKD
ncbi:MAG: DUF4198 domain-containing protein [Deltaproteobacteria bacterium]|nr:DUF4198 domain-containing protein [Deltaproteobacteria bacterium]MBW1913790.1 DUF4198 domain-containing protein [Deltaproteobacteria bacterium]